jgi:hypothetical protein
VGTSLVADAVIATVEEGSGELKPSSPEGRGA